MLLLSLPVVRADIERLRLGLRIPNFIFFSLSQFLQAFIYRTQFLSGVITRVERMFFEN